MHSIVVVDPLNQLKQGELVEGPASMMRAANRGVVLMPVDEDFVGWGVDGFSFAAFGKGWLVDAARATRGGSLAIRTASDRQYLYWTAGVRRANPEQLMSGTLKITSDTSRGDNGFSFSVDQPAQRLETIVEASGVVGGRNHLGSVAPGYTGISIFGVATNVIVEWLAVSQSRELADMHALLR